MSTTRLAFALFVGVALFGAASRRVNLLAKAHVGKSSTIPFDGTEGTSLPLGSSITWYADVENSNEGVLWFRFRVTGPDGVQHLIRDFSPDPELSWTTIDREGAYQMELTVRHLDSGIIDVQTASFQFEPIASGNKAAVVRTIHPLVLIYGAPRCAIGSTMKVQYTGPAGGIAETPAKTCGDATMNFYIAGLRKESTYQLRHLVTNSAGAATISPVLTETTGTPTYEFAPFKVVKAAPEGSTNPVVLYSSLFQPTVASDLSGNVIWYYLGQLTALTRPDGGGRFWGFAENTRVGPEGQILRQIDLAGSTLLETNAARINEQLAKRNMTSISGFHHEVRALPDGNILALAGTERILNGVQGDGDVDVLGDMILVLNRDLEVVWAWNSFDFLDTGRLAILNETCTAGGGAGCAPFFQAAKANDWLHGNSLQLTADGNILYSARHQDWVMKIDYQNGGGSGQVLWRLGQDGDFFVASTDLNPWFSHQHDAHFDANDPTMFYVFDNGNTRQSSDGSAHSRGQAYKIDEQARTATLVLNADLGDYSLALGSAARLPNGNYFFDLGWIQMQFGPTSRSVEVNPAGQIVFEIQAPTAFYRSVRLPSLYAAEAR